MPEPAFVLNGETRPLAPGLTVPALLRELGVNPARVAVAVNDRFYAPGTFPAQPLEPGDVVEVVRVMVGG